ncbi:MAG: CDC27 family protein [Planctomycetes bacterium]|nr:CDC27 family protein [Planctomycetota bacterium]
MKPLARILPLSLTTLVLALPAPAQQGQPAALMPADVFAYAEVDAGALDRGLHQLDLVQLLEDPEFYDFFLPLFETLGADPARPVDSLLGHLPVDQYLAGQAAIGVRGFRVWVKQPDGSETRLEIAPDSPIDARGLLDLAGMFASMGMDSRLVGPAEFGWNVDELSYEIGIDLVAVLDPGPALRQHVHEALAAPVGSWGALTELHVDDIAGRSVTHLSFDAIQTKGIVTDLYADLSGDRWVIATSLETFEAVITGAPADSLAGNPDFVKVRDRMTSGDPVLFFYGNHGDEMAILENFVPPILGEAADLLGCGSYVGSGFALSMTEGGVRESFGLVLDGQPSGLFRLLDAMPGGIDMAAKAPANAAALLSFKFDPEIFHGRVLELMETLLPGTGQRLGRMIALQTQAAGFDLEGEFLDVFGDEVSFVQFPPAGMMIPDWLLSVDVKDEAAARALIAKLQAIAAAEGAPVRFLPAELEGGIAAQKIVIPDAPILPPTMAVTGGRLLVASQPHLLVAAATSWGGDPGATMAAGEVYGRTMRGLTGGHAGDAALLAYADLRQIAPPVLMMTLGMIPAEFADVGAAPEIGAFAGHLGGVAIALRNDRDGVTLDTFGPVGMLLPAMAAGALASRRMVFDASQIVVTTDGGEEIHAGSANELNTQAWYLVRFAGEDDDSYQAGLKLARVATSIEPENHWFLNTLGVAQYRSGAFEKALHTFHRCEDMNQASSNQYDAASDVLFQAMCHWQLGHHDDARALLEKSSHMVGPGSDDEINAFYQEAHDLIGG